MPGAQHGLQLPHSSAYLALNPGMTAWLGYPGNSAPSSNTNAPLSTAQQSASALNSSAAELMASGAVPSSKSGGTTTLQPLYPRTTVSEALGWGIGAGAPGIGPSSENAALAAAHAATAAALADGSGGFGSASGPDRSKQLYQRAPRLVWTPEVRLPFLISSPKCVVRTPFPGTFFTGLASPYPRRSFC